MSKHLSARHLAVINEIGDRMLPGGDGFPRFSETGCVRHIDRIADYMPKQDLGDLKTLLLILSFLPGFLLGWVMGFLERSVKGRGPLAPTLRLIRIGLRGLIMSLYYGDPAVLHSMSYEVGVYRGA